MKKMLQCIVHGWCQTLTQEMSVGPRYKEIVTAIAEGVDPVDGLAVYYLKEYPGGVENGFAKSGFRELVDEQEANEYREQMKDFKPVPLRELQPELV